MPAFLGVVSGRAAQPGSTQRYQRERKAQMAGRRCDRLPLIVKKPGQARRFAKESR